MDVLSLLNKPSSVETLRNVVAAALRINSPRLELLRVVLFGHLALPPAWEPRASELIKPMQIVTTVI